MKHIQSNFDAGQAKIRAQNEDTRRGEFLRAIDDSDELLSDFETSFVGSFIKWVGARDPVRLPDLDFRWFTPGRRAVVDGMIHRYGFRGLKTHAASFKLPTAPAGCCGYLVRNGDTGRRECCGAKATTKTGRDLELCAQHAATRAAELQHLRDCKNKLRN